MYAAGERVAFRSNDHGVSLPSRLQSASTSGGQIFGVADRRGQQMHTGIWVSVHTPGTVRCIGISFEANPSNLRPHSVNASCRCKLGQGF